VLQGQLSAVHAVNEIGEDNLISEAELLAGIVWHRTMPTRLRLSFPSVHALKKHDCRAVAASRLKICEYVYLLRRQKNNCASTEAAFPRTFCSSFKSLEAKLVYLCNSAAPEKCPVFTNLPPKFSPLKIGYHSDVR